VTPYGLSTVFPDVQQITAGADGNMWFTESGSNMVGSISLNGKLTEYPVPTPNAGLGPITQGPDGNVWFGEIGKTGKITPAGNITEYAMPASGPYGLASGPDGNVWFTARSSVGMVGKIAPDGTITEYSLPGGLRPMGTQLRFLPSLQRT
jgi:virginiamycin B lyase